MKSPKARERFSPPSIRSPPGSKAGDGAARAQDPPALFRVARLVIHAKRHDLPTAGPEQHRPRVPSVRHEEVGLWRADEEHDASGAADQSERPSRRQPRPRAAQPLVHVAERPCHLLRHDRCCKRALLLRLLRRLCAGAGLRAPGARRGGQHPGELPGDRAGDLGPPMSVEDAEERDLPQRQGQPEGAAGRVLHVGSEPFQPHRRELPRTLR